MQSPKMHCRQIPKMQTPKMQSPILAVRSPIKEKTNKCCSSCSRRKNNTVWYKNSATGARDSVCSPCYVKDLRVRKARLIAAVQPIIAEEHTTAEE
jgi:hypothetical protein